MNLINYFFKRDYKKSYSQSGEDLIVDYLFGWLKVPKPTYLDIGAHQPKWLSNTYYFYKKGFTGVCIEPDPELFKHFRKCRKKDTCLNVGIGSGKENSADFYVMTLKTLNTFSRKEAETYMKHYDNCTIDSVIKINLLNINEVINKYFKSCPNFLSIDVEGIDFEVIKSLDLSSYRPEVICIETINYNADKSLSKATHIIDYMKSNDYFAYADTFINTIFVDKKAWARKELVVLENI